LRSLQEIQPDFEEEVKAYAGLWSQGKKKKERIMSTNTLNLRLSCRVRSEVSYSNTATGKTAVSYILIFRLFDIIRENKMF
jgi:hypothetical protein